MKSKVPFFLENIVLENNFLYAWNACEIIHLLNHQRLQIANKKMRKYEHKGIGKNDKDFEKNMNNKKSEIFQEIFQEISRNFSAFVEKTVLIRKIVLFFGLKKPY